jgi:hypothetical protein
MSKGTTTPRPLGDRVRRRLRASVVRPFSRRVVVPLRRMRNARRSYRPVFVTGAMGSGTTLMAFSLGQRFECAAIIAESGLQIDAASFLHMPPPESFASVGAYLEAMEADPGWSAERGREDLLQLYRSYASGGADVVIDKGPNANLIRAPFLLECFPAARFVLVFRDPVATIEGFRRKWPLFGRASLDEAIDFAAALHERFMRDATGFPDRVRFVSYETLTSRYDEVLEEVGRWADLETAKRLRHLETRADVEGRGIRNVRRGRVEVAPDANRKAYERMSDAEVARIRERLDPVYRALDELSPFRASSSSR